MQPLPLAYWQTLAQRRARVDGCPVLKITSTLAEALASIVTLHSGQTWAQVSKDRSAAEPEPSESVQP